MLSLRSLIYLWYTLVLTTLSFTIVHSIKYVLYLHLCGGECVSSMFGRDPGLVCISLHLSSCSDLSMK